MIFIAKSAGFCYNIGVMKKRTNYYVSSKNPLIWLMALCMVCSAVARILFVDMKGFDVASQIVLPMAAAILYALIALLNGKEHFYRTAVPVWLQSTYYIFVFWKFSFSHYDTLLGVLFTIILLVCGSSYGRISSGKWPAVWLLPIICLSPLACQVYLFHDQVLAGNWLFLLPDMLFALGVIFATMAVRIYNDGKYHPTWGDRSDGRKVRTEPAMNQVAPYIMVNRNGSTNYFTEAFEITQVERYIRKKRREGLTSFGILHVMMAAYCRTLCRYPKLNRFIGGQQIFSRGNDVQFCLTIKKEMTSDSPETVIKVHLTPTDTAEDVYHKINAEVDKAKNTPLDSGMDNTAALLTMIPGIVLKFVVWLLKTMDYFGLLPKFLLEVSPFHGSVFFTSMGSLGIPPIYHHLYDFGNLPVFGSFGCKRRSIEVLEDGTLVQRKYVDCKFTMDERICDGFYYAAFFKHFKRILMKPDVLDTPAEEVLSDID